MRAGTDAIDLPLFGLKDREVCFKTLGRAVAVQFAIPRRCYEKSALTDIRVASSSVKFYGRRRLRL